MSSNAAALRGVQRPRVELVPAFASSDVDDAVALAAGYGLVADDWQRHVLEAWLALKADAKWAAGRCGLAVPRQNGKNACIEIRELFGMIILGEHILHTAHEVKTARKAFARLKHFFGREVNDPRAKFPELNALVVELRSTNGQEAIILSNGGSIEFVARSRGSARGFSNDVLVLDEAQELTDEQLEALLPTISSGPLGNPQQIITGTPPGTMANGAVFTRIRKAGHEGKSKRLVWHEWSIAGTVDVYDRSTWAETNPALGIRLQETVVEDELPPDGLSLPGFMRERLGRWIEDGDSAESAFPAGSWESCLADKDKDEAQRLGLPWSSINGAEQFSFGIDVSADRTTTHITIAALNADGAPHVEVTASRAGTDWVIPWLREREARIAEVAGQGKGAPVSALLDDIEAAGFEVRRWEGPDLAGWTGQFYDLVSRGQLRRLDQPLLTSAADRAAVKPLGDAWVWNRRGSPVDIAPLVAATAAVGALLHRPVKTKSYFEDNELLVV